MNLLVTHKTKTKHSLPTTPQQKVKGFPLLKAAVCNPTKLFGCEYCWVQGQQLSKPPRTLPLKGLINLKKILSVQFRQYSK